MAIYSKFLLVLLLISATQLQAQSTLRGKVIRVIDGDTFDLLSDQQTIIRIRLLDIDTPERGQDFYKVSKQALSHLLFSKHVDVIWSKRDRNGRILGTVMLNEQHINLIMVRQGYAWHFKKYSSKQQFALAEQRARKEKLGLWVMNQPIAPWDFRKRRN